VGKGKVDTSPRNSVAHSVKAGRGVGLLVPRVA
jgi:hypothetical protein